MLYSYLTWLILTIVAFAGNCLVNGLHCLKFAVILFIEITFTYT